MPLFMGVDVGGVKFGLVVLQDGNPAPLLAKKYEYPKLKDWECTDELVDDFMVELDEHKPDLVCFEGYAFNPKKQGLNTVIKQARLGEMLRWATWKSDRVYCEVPPDSLKIVATGWAKKTPDGEKITKADIIDACHSVFKCPAGYVDDDPKGDKADAYVLAQIGTALRGANYWEPTPKDVETLDKIRFVGN